MYCCFVKIAATNLHIPEKYCAWLKVLKVFCDEVALLTAGVPHRRYTPVERRAFPSSKEISEHEEHLYLH